MSDAMSERRAQKDRVLEAALMHAAFDGWSRKTLVAAAADVGLDAGTARRLFPQGGDSLLDWLNDWLDREMLAAVADEDLTRLPVRRRIFRLVQARLRPLGPHREAMRRAVVARSMPGSLGGTGRAVWSTVDHIWQAAGMPGTAGEGWSWYTRRATLAGVIVSTFLYWMEDQSEDHGHSWAFLERRIEDVMRIGKLRGRLQDMLQSLPGLKPAR